ncbi:MAG: hypothetical protein KJZ83_19560 [Burkholderiaceae bacterium]|nr:hypothetical protein [Burkholderiaceae bacterium]
MRQLWIFLHLVSVVVWVGGMFFVHHCLRPAILSLAPPQRLTLMRDTLSRFFAYVAVSLVLLWASGVAMLLDTGLRAAPPAWHLMTAVAFVMTVVFAVIRLDRFPKFGAAVLASDWAGAAAVLGAIRLLVTVNLWLGLFTIAVATLGRLL